VKIFGLRLNELKITTIKKPRNTSFMFNYTTKQCIKNCNQFYEVLIKKIKSSREKIFINTLYIGTGVKEDLLVN
jgi:hypothetical protein